MLGRLLVNFDLDLLDCFVRVGLVSMPTHVHVKIGFADKVGDECLARFTFR
jgi:hypothetical protein